MKTIITVVVIILLSSAQPFSRAHAQSSSSKARAQSLKYSCPMHPEVVRGVRGKCPKCGMALKLTKTQVKQPNKEQEGVANAAKPGEKGDPRHTLQIPDVAVLDQDGNQLRFYTDLIKDKTVAINFIFTTCTTICPPLTATFRRVQQNLGEQVGRDVHLISISVDPETDVPERLKAYAVKFKAGPGWTFVTGDKAEIDKLLTALGAYVADKNDHTPTVLIGNHASGSWTRAYGLSPNLVTLIKAAAEKSKTL